MNVMIQKMSVVDTNTHKISTFLTLDVIPQQKPYMLIYTINFVYLIFMQYIKILTNQTLSK